MNQTRRELLKSAYERYSGEIIRYLNGHLRGNREEAQDIAQTAFLRLESINDLGAIENTRAFLYKTAKNLVVDGARRRETRDRYVTSVNGESQEEEQWFGTPEDIVIHRERLRLLEEVIVHMPPRRRRAFVLNRVHGLSYAEIARELGIGKEGVRKHVNRALAECATAAVALDEDQNCTKNGQKNGTLAREFSVKVKGIQVKR